MTFDGLANAGEDVLGSLDYEAARVAFLLDSDRGGLQRKKSLESAGVPSDRIVLLGQPTRTGLELEDLLRAELYRAAVNAEFAVWQPGRVLPASAIPSRGRVAALSNWCVGHNVPVPDKKRVASQVLALRGGSRLTTGPSRAILIGLHRQLRSILDRPRLGLAAADPAVSVAPGDQPRRPGDGPRI